jgi:hypothetical protein
LTKAAAETNIWPLLDASMAWPTQPAVVSEQVVQETPFAVRKSAPETEAKARPALALPKITSAAAP